jgi:uncharacterized protein
MDTPDYLPLVILQLAAVIAGLLLWTLHLRRRGPAALRQAERLPPWGLPGSDFVLLVGCVFAGAFGALTIARALFGSQIGEGADPVAITAIGGFAMHGGSLIGLVAFAQLTKPPRLSYPLPSQQIVGLGAAGFAMAVPVVIAITLPLTLAFRALGHEVAPQDLVGMFQSIDNPILFAAMAILAVVVAPLNEELLFRAGLFRFLRERMPFPGAAAVSSIAFALLHAPGASMPAVAALFGLAMLLCYLYARTGNLAVPIVAHALFNLNTLVVIVLTPATLP